MGLRERLAANWILSVTVKPLVRLARGARRRLRQATDLKTVRARRHGGTPLFLPAGYVYRRRPNYCVPKHASESDAVTQPDVYAAAAQAATVLGSKTIIDLGCGRGLKLDALSDRFQTVGVDFGENIARCRSCYDRGVWLEADLDKAGSLRLDPAVVQGATIVCADVIEHVTKPLALLALIREMLQTAGAAVISTPDRARLRGPEHLGPPPNAYHMREWSLSELRELITAEGLEIAYIGYTRSCSVKQEPNTIFCACVSGALAGEVKAAVTEACRQAVEEPLRKRK